MSKKSSKYSLTTVSPESTFLNLVSASIPVGEISSKKIQQIIDEMLAIANNTQGNTKKRTMVGLAAPQVGLNIRLIIVDVKSTGMGEKPDLRIFINPVITFRSTETEEGREGCFSTGNVCGIVARSSKINLEAYDRYGECVKDSFEGFTARIIQHEVDHLDGIRFPDKIVEAAKLHWVEPDRFGDYRERWQHWEQLCKRETWEAIKSGSIHP